MCGLACGNFCRARRSCFAAPTSRTSARQCEWRHEACPARLTLAIDDPTMPNTDPMTREPVPPTPTPLPPTPQSPEGVPPSIDDPRPPGAPEPVREPPIDTPPALADRRPTSRRSRPPVWFGSATNRKAFVAFASAMPSTIAASTAGRSGTPPSCVAPPRSRFRLNTRTPGFAHTPTGVQATGRDARGGKQCHYHSEWRVAKDADKFERRQLHRRGFPHLTRHDPRARLISL